MMINNKENKYQVQCTYPDGTVTYGELTDYQTATAWVD
jgi:hypothetical protein